MFHKPCCVCNIVCACVASCLIKSVTKFTKKANAVSCEYCENTASFIMSYRKELDSSFGVEKRNKIMTCYEKEGDREAGYCVS
jgi:hypothetical protein